jgi:hypothetical protein
MTDTHIRILRLMAHQSQRELGNYNASNDKSHPISSDRREHLKQAATRTSARVADAEQRRSRRANGDRDTHNQITSASRRAELLA